LGEVDSNWRIQPIVVGSATLMAHGTKKEHSLRQVKEAQ
jgi:hypothetical protein